MSLMMNIGKITKMPRRKRADLLAKPKRAMSESFHLVNNLTRKNIVINHVVAKVAMINNNA